MGGGGAQAGTAGSWARRGQSSSIHRIRCQWKRYLYWQPIGTKLREKAANENKAVGAYRRGMA